MNNIGPVQIFVRLETSDVRLLDIQRRIDKISLIQILVMRAVSLFEQESKVFMFSYYLQKTQAGSNSFI